MKLPFYLFIILSLNFQLLASEGFQFPKGCIERSKLPKTVIQSSPPTKDLFSGITLLKGTGWSAKKDVVSYYSKEQIEKILKTKIKGYSAEANFGLKICMTSKDIIKKVEILIKNSQKSSILKEDKGVYRALLARKGKWCGEDVNVKKLNNKQTPSQATLAISVKNNNITILGTNTWAKVIGGPLNRSGHTSDFTLIPIGVMDDEVYFDAISNKGEVDKWTLSIKKNELTFYKYKYLLDQKCKADKNH